MARRDKRLFFKKYITLVFIILLALLTKLSLILFAIDTISTRRGEDLIVGTIAKELIDGPAFPLLDYQKAGYENGLIVEGILAVPFFLLFGDSLFSLKLVALTFLLSIVIVFYFFLFRYFGWRICIIASVLFILSPIEVTMRSLVTWGNHVESLFFSFLSMFIFYRIFLDARTGGNRFLLFFVFGLVCGFATYFAYIFLITLITYLLYWFMIDRKFIFRKQFLIFLGSFIVGFSPGIYYNIVNKFEGIYYVRGEPFYSYFIKSNIFEPLLKFKNLIFYDLANIFSFGGKFITYIYIGIFMLFLGTLLLSSLKLILKSRRTVQPGKESVLTPAHLLLEMPIVIYIILYFLIYSVTNFRHLWYLIPLFPFMTIVIAIGIDKMWLKNNKYIRALAILILSILLLIGIKGESEMGITSFRFRLVNNFGKVFHYKGYSYSLSAISMIRRFEFEKRDFKKIIAVIDWINKKKYKDDFQLHHCYEIWGKVAGLRFGEDIEKLISLVDEKIDKIDKPYCYIGVGKAICLRNKGDLMKSINSIFDSVDKINEEYRPYCYEGIGEVISSNWQDNIHRIDLVNAKIEEKYKPYYYKGIGKGIIGFIYEVTKSQIDLVGTEVEEKYKPYYFEGVGEMFAPLYFAGLNLDIEFRQISDLINDKIDKKYALYCIRGYLNILREYTKYNGKNNTL